MKKQYPQLDIVKYIAALFVIVIHVFTVFENPYINYFFVQIIGRLSVPFFFACSAFMVAHRRNEPGYLKKYTISLLWTYLVVSLVYLPFGIHYIMKEVSLSLWMIPLVFLAGFLYIGTYYHLWFIPALLFALWFVHFCFEKFGKKITFIIVLALFLFGSLETYYYVLPDSVFHKLFDMFQSLLFTTRNGLFYGTIFIWIGYTLYEQTNRKTLPIVLVMFLLFAVEAIFFYNIETIDFNFLWLSVPFTYYFLSYLLTLKCKVLTSTSIRRYATDYYFWHILVLEIIRWISPNGNGIFVLVLTIAGTHVLSEWLFKIKFIEKTTHIIQKIRFN